jgi:NADH:ubiquinone oxidoreductase subunit F (NADH-binding)
MVAQDQADLVEVAGGPPDSRALKAIFPGASNTVLLPPQLDMPLDFDAMRQAGSAWERAGSRCSTTRHAWCRRPGGTRGSCS